MKRFISKHQILILAVLLIGFAVAGILLNPSLTYPGRDGGIFLYIGSLILKGRIPYLEVWENKGPLVFYINALGLWLAAGSRWGVWLMEFIFLSVSGFLGYQVLRRSMAHIPALVGAVVWILAAGSVLQGGNYSEEYSLLFTFLAVFGYWVSLGNPRKNWPVFLIGVSLGMNFLLRPNNISMQIAAAACYFIYGILFRDWQILFRRALWFVIGFLIVLIPSALYYYFKGALDELIQIVFVFNFKYTNGLDMTGLLEGLLIASRAIGWVYIGLALFGYLLCMWYWHRHGLKHALGQFLLLLVIGWPIEAFLSALSGRNYLHYFIGWAPFVGFFVAFTVFELGKALAVDWDRFAPAVALGLITLVTLGKADVFMNYGNVILGNVESDYRDPVALYIIKNTSSEDKVLIWGFRPIINFVTGRESPVSYLPYPLIHVDSELGRYWGNQFYEQLTADPPIMIVNMIDPDDRNRIPDLDPQVRKEYNIKKRFVVLAPNWRDTLSFIEQNYIAVADVDGSRIYRLIKSP